ncbi:MAG: relaxase domain-containing protein, partial [Acidimicrobiales bacterium]
NDVRYFTSDAALELDGLRDGSAGWWLRGRGDTTDPGDVESVLGTTERSAVHGYDIIVAAPRPISILIAVDPEHGASVVAAHRSSVGAAVNYLEEHSLVVRDRRNGADRDESGRWRSIVSFTHGVNRHGEPHLHDHVLVGAQPEHSRTVLDSRGLFAHALAADALYRTSLRHELAQRTPWTAWRSFKGIEHVAGLDEGYRALWGGHHLERGEKLRWERSDARGSWLADQQRFSAQGVIDPPSRHRTTLDEHGFAGAFEGRADVARRHVIEAWSNAARFGQDPSALALAVDDLYPQLAGGGGVREPMISVREARMTALVREYGERPLERGDFAAWRQRSRDLSRNRSERSR